MCLVMWQERFQLRVARCIRRASPSREGRIRLGLWLGLIVGLLALIGPFGQFAAANTIDGVVVRSVRASDAKILAESGQTTLAVIVGGLTAGETEVSLTATLGSFGGASGPARIVLTLQASARDATVTAELFGDGRSGTAIITARVGESTRSTAVLMAGVPVSIEFEAPETNAVHDAALPVPITLQLRDAGGITVPDTIVQLRTDDGVVSSATATPSFLIALVTDRNGRARASLRAAPGLALLRAGAGDVSASLEIMLHGPPVSLDLIAIRDILHAGIAPPGTLVAVLLDDGGRPVPDVFVAFATDRDDASISHNGLGESGFTDDTGRATGHVVSDAAVEPGEITISVAAGNLNDSVTLVLVGPPSQLVLTVTSHGAGSYTIAAQVFDLESIPIPDGFDVHWSATGLAFDLASLVFDPPVSPVGDGRALTLVNLDQPTLRSVQIVARVTPQGVVGEDLEMALAAALVNTLPLPDAPTFDGALLEAGINVVRWASPGATVAEAVAPIKPLIVTVWYFDAQQGWIGYFPTVGVGGGVELSDGSRFYVFVSQPTQLRGAELIGR